MTDNGKPWVIRWWPVLTLALAILFQGIAVYVRLVSLEDQVERTGDVATRLLVVEGERKVHNTLQDTRIESISRRVDANTEATREFQRVLDRLARIETRIDGVMEALKAKERRGE